MKIKLKHNIDTLNEAFGVESDTVDRIANELIVWVHENQPTYSQLIEHAVNKYATTVEEAIYMGIIAFKTPAKVKAGYYEYLKNENNG